MEENGSCNADAMTLNEIKNLKLLKDQIHVKNFMRFYVFVGCYPLFNIAISCFLFLCLYIQVTISQRNMISMYGLLMFPGILY